MELESVGMEYESEATEQVVQVFPWRQSGGKPVEVDVNVNAKVEEVGEWGIWREEGGEEAKDEEEEEVLPESLLVWPSPESCFV